MKQWKRINYQEALNERMAIEDAGHTITMYTDWHWKIDGIDVWPSAKKFMKNGRVSHYEKLADVVK